MIDQREYRGRVLTSHHLSAILPAGRQAGWRAADWATVARAAVTAAGLHEVGLVSKDFVPHGSSIVVLLEESHLALHHWPECERLTVDIHVCDYHRDNEAAAWQLARSLTEVVGGVAGQDWSYRRVDG